MESMRFLKITKLYEQYIAIRCTSKPRYIVKPCLASIVYLRLLFMRYTNLFNVCNKCLVICIYIFELVSNFSITIMIIASRYNVSDISENLVQCT